MFLTVSFRFFPFLFQTERKFKRKNEFPGPLITVLNDDLLGRYALRRGQIPTIFFLQKGINYFHVRGDGLSFSVSKNVVD